MAHKDDDLSFLEGDKHPAVMIIGGVILVAIIIVVCVVVWNITHKNQEDGLLGDNSGMMEENQSMEEGQSVNEVMGQSDSQPDTTPEEEEPFTEEDYANGGEGQPGETASNPNQTVDGGTAGGMQQGDESGLPEGGSSSGRNEVIMSFSEVSDTVTAKEQTNLRSVPSSEGTDTVVVQLKNGETITRTGINQDTGWSRLDYNGQTVYAVSRLLTTDLTSKANTGTGQTGSGSSVASTNGNTVVTADERKITFTSCDDTVSPKNRVNLRSEPSTAQGNDTIHYTMEYGDTAHRTGYDEASGWSRVEYNGEVMYAITSYLYVVEVTVE